MHVPFIDLAAQYAHIKQELNKAIEEVFESGNFIGGEPVRHFENSFANFCSVRHCVGVGNATDALFLSLKALDIGPGDEVLTPAWSWISTAEVITLTGARPVFVDVHPDLFAVSPLQLAEKFSSKTKAVILVHLYGQMAETKTIKALCDQHKVFLIEDCSQAHLSEENGVAAGSIGNCGIFSFYPTKNLGAYGDAGCLVTNEDGLAERVRRLANHGGLGKDDHLIEGTNSRLDTLQAAMLTIKLKYLHAWTQQRIENAQLYYRNLKGTQGLSLPELRGGVKHSFHQFVIKTKKRNELKEFLLENDVHTLIHYPKALPFEPAYHYLKHKENDFPISAQLQDSVLSLPIYPELLKDQIVYVCDLIKSFYGNR